MDALRLLEQQHDEVKELFKKFEKSDGERAAKLFADIRQRLELHEELEETHLYPQLKQDPKAGELVLESYQEHHVMDLLIQEIGQLKPDDEAFDPKVKVLQENTEHHIEEEEKQLFPMVRKIWDVDKREQVGRAMQDMQRSKQGARSKAA
jgi:hemerythrin superfamily protein